MSQLLRKYENTEIKFYKKMYYDKLEIIFPYTYIYVYLNFISE